MGIIRFPLGLSVFMCDRKRGYGTILILSISINCIFSAFKSRISRLLCSASLLVYCPFSCAAENEAVAVM